jgi:hypothetical protein
VDATTLADGTYTARATQADDAGNLGVSTTLTFTVDTVTPDAPEDLALDAASDSGTAGDNLTNDPTPTITGTAEANATLEVFDGTTSLGTTTTDGDGNWSFANDRWARGPRADRDGPGRYRQRPSHRLS